MYDRIKIKGFRCFEDFEAQGLTRVNLLVGKNNSGKTAFLEAVELGLLGGRLYSLALGSLRRSELRGVQGGTRNQAEAFVQHLFHGHDLYAGACFDVRLLSDTTQRFCRCELLEREKDSQVSASSANVVVGREDGLTIALTGSVPAQPVLHQLSPQGTFLVDPTAVAAGVTHLPGDAVLKVSFVPTKRPDLLYLQHLWEDLVLTDEETYVHEIMKIVEPTWERLAFQTRGTDMATAKVKLSDRAELVHLGTLGEGMYHLFTIALHMASSGAGALLIDEIDTGLHYSTLQPMWRFIIKAARRLDVQVFATTHSQDCIRALAGLQQESPELAGDVSVHRIEQGAKKSIRYSAEEIEIAAEHRVEIRGVR